MPRIHTLDPALVNQIAAGEVIERPASVVKELLENAIDAGATRIDIALEDGGVRLIRVTDNGCGIAPEELPLAVAPHATSKLESAEDLFRIRTMGFRGEALASIASVSHLVIRSRTADHDEAFEMHVQSAGEQTARRTAGPPGTTLEVRNLFYNLPARRKFLRQAPAELAGVTEQLARLALAHPDIAFSLSHNGRTSRNLPPTADRRTRIADFYGTDLAECLIPIEREERGLTLSALIAPPAHSRATTKWQYLFLNGRFIADKRIAFAIREAFRGLVEAGRYPVVFIFLTTAPDQFDVNVHPTKIEVRWRDGGLMQSQVLAVLRETLLTHDLTPALQPQGPAVTTGVATEQHASGVRRAVAEYLRSIDPTQARLRFEPARFATSTVRPTLASDYAVPRPPPLTPDVLSDRWIDPSMGVPAIPAGRADLPTPAPPEAVISDASPGAPGSTDRFAHASSPDLPPESGTDAHTELAPSAIQIHNTYLVAQTDEGVIIVDQHALHERILYEKFRRRILAGPLESQRLLIPQTLGVSPAQAQAAQDHRDMLVRLGLEVELFGPRSIAIQAFPVLMADADVLAFVRDLLDRLAETGQVESPESLVHSALDMMACKAAVKAGDPLNQDEIQSLLAQRHLIERSSNCPHGRPTTLQLTTRDLEKQFKRV
jgi:DNA mismatch repair protein MutL